LDFKDRLSRQVRFVRLYPSAANTSAVERGQRDFPATNLQIKPSYFVCLISGELKWS